MCKSFVRRIGLVAVSLLLSSVGLCAQSALVTLDMQDVRLKDVIESVEGQTRYLFAADAGINLDQRVSVQVKDVSLREVLDQLASQAGLLYSVNGSNILLSQKEPQRSRTLTGRVTDEAGEPLVGAGVRVEGQPTIGTVTDFAGAYSLPVPLDAAAIRVSYIGMEDAVIPIGTQNRIDVVLRENLNELEGVVDGTLQDDGSVLDETGHGHNAQPSGNITWLDGQKCPF